MSTIEIPPDPSPIEPDDDRRGRVARRVILVVLGVLALQLAIAALLAFVPVAEPDTDSRPRPSLTYVEAVDRFDAVRAEEADASVDPECRSRLLSKQGRTDVAVVVFHRLGGCSATMMRFARALYDRGANVYVARLPGHGGGDLGAVSAEDLRVAADSAVDIGDGLGREVRVVGVSLGGVLAAWVGQNRSDVARAVAVAPPLTRSGGSDLLDYMYVNTFRRVPDLPVDTSTRVTAAMQQLADAVVEDSLVQRPRAVSIAVVTSRNDEGTDEEATTDLTANWRGHGGDVLGYEFAKRLELPHDLIDTTASGARPGVTYPVLLDLVLSKNRS